MSTSVPFAELKRLFTMTFTINRALEMNHVSAALTTRCPEALDGTQMGDVFSLHRPRGVSTFEEILQDIDTLYLLISRKEDIALRGQMISLEGSDQLMFVGSPWLPWMSEHNPDVKLGLSEFPRHDPQMDAVFYEETQRAMVHDLELVNNELRGAKERAEQTQKIQSDFFAVMSHEMRTPLNGIITSLSLSRESANEKEKEDLLKVAHTSANNLMSVINYVLDFSKLEAGELAVEEEEFDIFEMVNSIGDILLAKASARNLRFDIEVAPDVPRWVQGDGSKLRQILINLASNAVKFSSVGGVTIRVTSEAMDGESVRINFQVIDTGTGIAPEHQDRIFDAFWTLTEKTPAGEANTGLGLNICQRITTLLGGDLSFESTLGEGTSFNLSLVLTRCEHTSSREESIDLAMRFEGHVLLVDDNQTNLFVGGLMLERMGLDVRTASDGVEALELVKERAFDLVLMDVTMPEMDGETATREIRKLGFDVPIIALTAHVGEELAAQYAQSGMQGVVFKPINKAELIRTLSGHLTGKAAASISRVAARPLENEVLDVKILETLVSNIGQANFAAASALFGKELETRVNALKSAWVQRDYKSMAIESHTLKSSSVSFGALELSKQMDAVEKASRSHDVQTLVGLLPDVDATVRRAQDSFTSHIVSLAW
ncbi:MAG: signal transduction histidine kinase/DNA-binding response OmpR family regulator [Candidatus Azotimanducaceae bacterium]|jgi:signal transduction histidine kinase/DNA-binding response OmpR family regulator